MTIDAQFRVYHNIAESIADHAELLATSGYYQRAMADRAVPDAFANDLTGVYATDPEYGSNLIALMQLYNLYRFDAPGTQQQDTPAVSHTPRHRAAHGEPRAVARSGGHSRRVAPTPSAAASSPAASPSGPAATPSPSVTPTRPRPAPTAGHHADTRRHANSRHRADTGHELHARSRRHDDTRHERRAC